MKKPIGKCIGKGKFTKCYREEDSKTVTLISTDPFKECMSLGWFPDHPMFPKVERIDQEDGVGKYVMDYYPNKKSLKHTLEERQYKLYKELRRVYELLRKLYRDNYWAKPERLPIDLTREALGAISDDFKEEREALLGAADGCTMYSSNVYFEISPRNVRSHKQRLILLDVFFIED